MVQGPVRIEMPDGSVVESDRFMVAICTCRRSKNYPLCDTSHRRRQRSAEPISSAACVATTGRPPTGHHVRGEPVLDEIPRPDAEYHVAVQMWFARNEIPDDIGTHHLFVDGVGFDVLA